MQIGGQEAGAVQGFGCRHLALLQSFLGGTFAQTLAEFPNLASFGPACEGLTLDGPAL